MNLIVLNYIDLISKSVLNLLNEESIPTNARGKLFIALTKQNKDKLKYYLKSELYNNTYFGKTTLVINTCNVENNWRNSIENFTDYKYKICDESVWLDPTAMIAWFDKLWIDIQKNISIPKIDFMQFSELDTIDIKYALNNIFKVDILTENWYNIIEDGNIVFKRYDYPDFIIEDIKFVLRNKNLLI